MALFLTNNETLNGSHCCPSQCRSHSDYDSVATDTESPSSPPPYSLTPFCSSLISLMVSVDVKHHVYLLLRAACISVCCFYCLSTQTFGKSFRGRWLCDTYGEYFGRQIIIIKRILERPSTAQRGSTGRFTITPTHTHERTHARTHTRASDEGIRTAVKNSLEIITRCERCAKTRSAP